MSKSDIIKQLHTWVCPTPARKTAQNLSFLPIKHYALRIMN